MPIGRSSLCVGLSRLAGNLVFGLLVTMELGCMSTVCSAEKERFSTHNQPVQEASWLAGVMTLPLGVISFFAHVLGGFFIG